MGKGKASYERSEYKQVKRFGEMWLDRAHEEGVRWVEIWLYKGKVVDCPKNTHKIS